MKTIFLLVIFMILCAGTYAQQSYNITFPHTDKLVFGTITVPPGDGPFPAIIINHGTGVNDRDLTIPMVGDIIPCLYPDLLNEILKPYKELAEALVDSGYAVLRYDKIEFTYPPVTLGAITFEKLWLPVESAIDYLKTRDDVDTNKIILIGHSEGSSIIPFIAKNRNDVRALISIAGPRTPLDSLIDYQLAVIADSCNGDPVEAETDGQQILDYFHIIRTNTWSSNTPALFGVPANAWYDYVLATDPVAENYNEANLPTLFIGLGKDLNVPPSELIRLQNDVTISNDFWTIPDVVHFMVPYNDPHVSIALSDTIVYWLREHEITTGINQMEQSKSTISISPNPFTETLEIHSQNGNIRKVHLQIYDIHGRKVLNERNSPVPVSIQLPSLSPGMYLCVIREKDGTVFNAKVMKM